MSPCARQSPLVALVLACACASPAPSELECTAWSRPDGDRCVLRAWTVPAVDDALSEPGARDVQAALGRDGDALVAWAHVVMNADGPVVLAERRHETWTLMHALAGPGSGLEPAVAVGDDGAALVTWKQQREDGAVYLATRDREGRWRWPAADAPLSWSETAYEPRVALAPDGEALVLWNQWTGAHFGVALGRREAASEGPFVLPSEPAQLLSPAVNYANAPRLAVGEDGELLVAWYQAPVDDLMVYVSERREPGEPPSQPPADGFLSPSGGPVDSHAEANPWPALHASGVAAVAWTQQHGEWDFPVYLATREPDGVWHRPSSIDDTLSRPGAFARCPQVAFASAVDADEPVLFVTWFETRGDETTVHVWQGSSDRTGIAEPIALSSPGAEAVHPALGVGPRGGMVVAWAEREGDARWRVVARRYQPHTDAWLPSEPLSLPVAGLAPTPVIAVAPDSERVLVAWAQGGVLDGRVYVAELP
ncbi:hypothetical protein [Paraliomyxa miuraensis]|uniref:hypothetical protein n=1 Tax=Paraliomyxa miuraensis TaxID=376150 RepID=UPI00225860F1|nr:hypothetical protein [Paraliomyxa miuraensis]MCX4247227.1 hypothetical protein [Paraliomyxa miuraensis]